MTRHVYTIKKPASWHNELWREALPLGNGLTGVLIPGCIGKELIYFNRHDLWEGGVDKAPEDITDSFFEMRKALDEKDYSAANRENMAEALKKSGYSSPKDCPHPFGWMDIDFEPQGLFYDYQRGVDMRNGESFVEFTVDGCRYRRSAFVSRADDVVVMKMSAEKPFTASYGFRLYNKLQESKTTEKGFYRASQDAYTELRAEFVGEYSSFVEGDKLTVTGKDYTILIRCASLGSDCSLDKLLDKSYDELKVGHVKLHRKLYDGVDIRLATEKELAPCNEKLLCEAYESFASPALIERLWRFGRYLFISAASEKGNPVPLYGLWHGDRNLRWSQYVANENVQCSYWHALAGGLAYSLPPLIRYYTKKTETLRKCAKNLFGTRGIWLSAYSSPNCSAVCVQYAVIINWISCAGWLCRHFWEYYLYTKDEKMLRNEILPFMYEAALFFCDYAVEDGEYIKLYPSVSPENEPLGLSGAAAQNATMDFAVMKELFENLLSGISITGMYQNEKEAFLRLLKKIPPYMINEDGAVKEWMHPDYKDNYYHRHLSHIYPVFPGNEVTKESDPRLFDAFKKAVKLRKLGAQTGWSLAHMASVYARIGEGEDSAKCIDAMAKAVIMDSLLTTHNDWRNMGTTIYWKGEATMQLDAAFGVVNAVQEMLFCKQKDHLSVLPSLPKRLNSGKAKGLVFPEGKIDIFWNKSFVKITIKAKTDFKTRLLLQGEYKLDLNLEKGERKSFEFSLK